MAGTVRAKFYVAEVSKLAHGSYNVTLRAVTKHGPHDPADNEFFWDATPSGELKLQLSGDAGKGAFEYFDSRLSKDIYLDMIDAEGVYAKCQPTHVTMDGKYVVLHQPGCPEHDAALWAETQGQTT